MWKKIVGVFIDFYSLQVEPNGFEHQLIKLLPVRFELNVLHLIGVSFYNNHPTIDIDFEFEIIKRRNTTIADNGQISKFITFLIELLHVWRNDR